MLTVDSIYYETINELVEENKNGLLFRHSNDLSKILKNVNI